MNIRARKALVFSALIAVLLGGLFAGPARAQDRAEIDRLFNEAQSQWQEGNSEKAVELLMKVIGQNPSHAMAYDLLRKAEYQMFLDMLKEGGDSQKVAKALLDLAHLGERAKVKDEDAIRSLVKDVIEGADYGVREKAIKTLVARHGEYAVPYLFGYLGSNDTDPRVYAILALSELGPEAVLPLVEALHSDNFRIQQNAALVLQKIGDIRAVGGLLSLAGRAENPAVKASAMQAAASMGAENISAANAYITLARKYYERDRAVIKNILGDYTVWKWTDGKMIDRQVPGILYRFELAEESCYDALDEDPENPEARALLTAVHCGEWGAIAALTEAERSDVQEHADRLWNVIALSASQGPDSLLGALAISIEWHDANIARGALAILPEIWDGRTINPRSPMIAALGVADKTVRFAAAICLLKIMPGRPFPAASQVVPIAAQAVDTIGVRQVLLVEPDPGLRTKMLRALDEAGFYSASESTGTAGFRRAKDVGSFDVIVIRAALEDKLALTVVNQLRDDFRTADASILISASNEEMDGAKALYGTKVDGYIDADAIDTEAIKIASDQDLSDEQTRARDISRQACEALALIDKKHTAFGNYAEAVPALISMLSSDKPDENRLAALAALAAVGTPDAGKALAETFKDTASAVEIRIGAAQALGRCYAGIEVPEQVFDALLAGLGDEERGIRKAVGDAFGEMKLTAEQRNVVLKKYRVR